MLEFLFKKVAGLQTWKFTKKRLQHRCYLVNIKKFLRTPILKNVCERRLLVCYVSVSASFQQPQKTSLELEKVISLCKFAENTPVFFLWNAKLPRIFWEKHNFRNSSSEVFCKKGVLKNFASFNRKTPVAESLFKKSWRPEAGLQLYYTRNSDIGVFLWTLWNF